MRDTLFSVIWLVICALAVRVFVVEAYVIPSGSMAPTLLGIHQQARCGHCGHAFAVEGQGAGSRRPLHCPVCRQKLEPPSGPLLGGDRILVAKFPARPRRWDVVVFRAPQEHDPLQPLSGAPGPQSFFIKRAVGLPGEDLHLLDGHVFVRKPGETDFKIVRRADPKENPRWEAVSRAAWRPLWRQAALSGERLFDFEAMDGQARCAYDDATLHPYNQPVQGLKHRAQETVEDLRLAALTRGPASLACSTSFAGNLVLLRATDGSLLLAADQKPLGRLPPPALASNLPVRLELWLLDREALVFADGLCVMRHAFDAPWADILAAAPPPDHPRILFQGDLAALEVDAALPYLPGGRGLENARGGLVRAANGHVVMAAPVTLPSGDGGAQACWFCLGDNSPTSVDGRFWNSIHPDVQERLMDGHAFFGLVPESLLVGRAACVFWPADDAGGALPGWGKIRRIR